MAPLFSLLLLLLLLFPLLTHSLSPLINQTCHATRHYALCMTTLSSSPAAANVKSISSLAISAALFAAANASSYASGLASARGPAARTAPLGACAERYGDARQALQSALDAVAEDEYDYALVDVGAAAEYPTTCWRLFSATAAAAVAGGSRTKYPAGLARREQGLVRLCGLASDIIALLVVD